MAGGYSRCGSQLPEGTDPLDISNTRGNRVETSVVVESHDGLDFRTMIEIPAFIKETDGTVVFEMTRAAGLEQDLELILEANWDALPGASVDAGTGPGLPDAEPGPGFDAGPGPGFPDAGAPPPDSDAGFGAPDAAPSSERVTR